MTIIPDSFDELCLVELQQKGGTAVAFACLTEDITGMDWGEKDIEGKPMLCGGRVVRKIPMTDESITLKMYPISAGLPGEATARGKPGCNKLPGLSLQREQGLPPGIRRQRRLRPVLIPPGLLRSC